MATVEELQKEIACLRKQLEDHRSVHYQGTPATVKKDAPASRARRSSLCPGRLQSVQHRKLEGPPETTKKGATQLSDITCFTPCLVHSSKWKDFFRPKSRLQLSQGTGEALTFELDLNALAPSPPKGGSSVSPPCSPSEGRPPTHRNRLEWWKELLLKETNCVRKRYQMQASPLSALTLRQEEREHFGVPSKSCWFCYCYPIEALSSYIARDQSDQEDPVQEADWPLVLWLLYGAFLYFDARLEILRINAVSFHQRPDLLHMTATDQSEGTGIMMVQSFPLYEHRNQMRSLSYRFLEIWKRWCALPIAPVPKSELKNILHHEEATSENKPFRIAWINPSEVLGDDVYGMFGGFAFASPEDQGKESARYFAIDCERILATLDNEPEDVHAVNADIDKASYSDEAGSATEDDARAEGGDSVESEEVQDAKPAEFSSKQSLSVHVGRSRSEGDNTASPMHSVSPTSRSARKLHGPLSVSAGNPVLLDSPLGVRAGSRSKSTATVTGLIDVSVEIAEQLQEALLKLMRDAQSEAKKAHAAPQTTLQAQFSDASGHGSTEDGTPSRQSDDDDVSGERGGEPKPCHDDPSTWTEEFLELAVAPATNSSSSQYSERKDVLKARVKFFAKLHLHVGLPLRVPVPIKLLALTGFGGSPRKLSFKECLWAQDKHDLAHSNGCRVLFHLSAQALQQEDKDTKDMLRGAFKDLDKLLGKDSDAEKRGEPQLVQLLQLRASPLNTVTLPGVVRIKAGIPASAQFYSFCYPLDKSQHNPRFCACQNKQCPGANSKKRRERVSLNCPTVLKKELLTLLLRGGFLYFDATYDIVAVNAWTSYENASSKNLLHFGPSVELPWSAHKALAVFGRWCDVTHEAADKHGFAQMAWINPHEVIADHIFSRHGGLAFKRRSAAESQSQATSSGYLSDDQAKGPGDEDLEAEGVFYPIVLGSSECLDVEAYEADFSPKHYDMAIDFPVMGDTSEVSGKFGSVLTRAPSGGVNLVQFHQETKKAALGIKGLFGQEGAADSNPLEAIRQEFLATSSWITKEDIENMKYVLDCPAKEEVVEDNTASKVKLIRDKGHDGMTLDSFWNMPHAQNANLEKHEVAALRIYTTSSFHCINDPLRDDQKQHPHPLPKTTRFIYEALKKMRAVHLEKGSSFRPRYLWRGLRNLKVDDVFMRNGGTELACMSTSEDINIVAKYCQCDEPLVFRIRVASPMDLGADISWLSCFPHEKEVLYPPLTYLKPLYRQEIKSRQKGSVITVEVRFPS